ncbi:MAG: homocysteine S-methyltransferase family protein [Candidatus Eisenbacteria bacterium]|uniref:Homocysteine S-methyltransferase family protein n=1 Tax=Eiseniibacteriota bacterium TaxID=2212470 RepID=A0A538TCA3_UNCEI|nr:MAG: homocysteine S-methyltransferase family protein [Candidatus Eisenbacteria bacterium]
MSRNNFRSRLNRGELILLDGAMGTELERRGIPTPLPLWSAAALLDHPDQVREIHEDYVRAGADVITADTFRTTPRALEKAGRAREEARVLTQRAVALTPDAELALREHTEQASFLARCGVDLILAETMNSIAEAMAAVRGAKATGLPVLVSFICKDGREVLSGESLEDAVRAVEPLKPDAVLVNCVGPETAAECLLTMGRATRVPLGCYPNAGEPDLDKRAWCFDPSWTPERFAEVAGTWLARGAQIIGGCCGTGPEHIRALRLALPPVLVE